MKSDRMTTVASWFDEELLESVESLRWPVRMTRSEFIRRATKFYIETLHDGFKRPKRINGRR
jgi:metal-responsive CopG/Arc/MetJ family transcriptional regulator